MRWAHIRLIGLATLASTLSIQSSCGLLSRAEKSSKIQFIQGSKQQSAILESKDLKD